MSKILWFKSSFVHLSVVTHDLVGASDDVRSQLVQCWHLTWRGKLAAIHCRLVEWPIKHLEVVVGSDWRLPLLSDFGRAIPSEEGLVVRDPDRSAVLRQDFVRFRCEIVGVDDDRIRLDVLAHELPQVVDLLIRKAGIHQGDIFLDIKIISVDIELALVGEVLDPSCSVGVEDPSWMSNEESVLETRWEELEVILIRHAFRSVLYENMILSWRRFQHFFDGYVPVSEKTHTHSRVI